MQNHRLALVLLALAFCIKALIPAGYMVSSTSDHVLALTICSETTGSTKTILVNVGDPESPDAGHSGDPATDGKCAFSGLSHAAVGGADAIQLALALAAILVLALAASWHWPWRRSAYLRPPLRGPPLTV